MAHYCQQTKASFNVPSKDVGKFLFYASKTPFDFIYTSDGDIVGIQFTGCFVPDMNLMKYAAAYVTDGSFIEMCGEQNDYWRYVFKGGKLKEVEPKTTIEWEE